MLWLQNVLAVGGHRSRWGAGDIVRSGEQGTSFAVGSRGDIVRGGEQGRHRSRWGAGETSFAVGSRGRRQGDLVFSERPAPGTSKALHSATERSHRDRIMSRCVQTSIVQGGGTGIFCYRFKSVTTGISSCLPGNEVKYQGCRPGHEVKCVSSTGSLFSLSLSTQLQSTLFSYPLPLFLRFFDAC